jgi:hypothetical protein
MGLAWKGILKNQTCEVARCGRDSLALFLRYGCSHDFDFEPIGGKATKTIPGVQIQLGTEGVIGGASG